MGPFGSLHVLRRHGTKPRAPHPAGITMRVRSVDLVVRAALPPRKRLVCTECFLHCRSQKKCRNLSSSSSCKDALRSWPRFGVSCPALRSSLFGAPSTLIQCFVLDVEQHMGGFDPLVNFSILVEGAIAPSVMLSGGSWLPSLSGLRPNRT